MMPTKNIQLDGWNLVKPSNVTRHFHVAEWVAAHVTALHVARENDKVSNRFCSSNLPAQSQRLCSAEQSTQLLATQHATLS